MAWIARDKRRGKWVARWQEGGKTRSKSFDTEVGAMEFLSLLSGLTIDATEGPQDRSAKYTHSAGTYTFELPTRVLALPKAKLLGMLEQYSHHGKGWAGKLVATHNDMTEREFRCILKSLGFVKGDFPYLDEDAATTDPDELAEHIAATVRTQVDRKIMRRVAREEAEDAQKWRNLEHAIYGTLVPAITTAGQNTEPVQPRTIRRAPQPFALVVPVTDLHVGKKSWSGYGPGEFNYRECRRRLREAIDQVLAWLPGAPEKIILPIGGDFFQADTVEGKTSRGTPQDMDGTPEQMIAEGYAIAFALVRELAAICQVELVYNRGNHDAALSMALFCGLEQAFVADPKVSVLDDEHRYSPYQVTEYGIAAIGFAHGDGRSKPGELASIMAQRWPHIWARTKVRHWHLGHVHHEKVIEGPGIKAMTNPSLSGSDRYHGLHWPVENQSALAAHVYDRARGHIATIYGIPGEET